MFNKIYENIKKFMVNNYNILLVWLIFFFVCTYEFPYVVYKPGGIVKLSERVKINEENNINGEIAMSYVSLMRGNIPVILLSYILPNWDLVPDEEVTIDGESIDELIEMEKLYMTSSLDNATILAYQKAGAHMEITKTINNVIYITDEAKTDIKLYDQILSVEGIEVKSVEEIQDVIKGFKKGDKVEIVVLRKDKKIKTYSEIYEIDGELKVGIATLTTYEYQTDPVIDISRKSSESGSSGGLMLTLAIYDSLVEEDIAKGRNIVGTGTIDIEGNVGDIDGVKYKLLGAVKNKANIFLCPINNFEEAEKIKKENDLDIEIIGVKTFDEALEYLTK